MSYNCNFAGNMVSEFLPPQLIYKGKTTASLPSSVKFPEGLDLTSTNNHWANKNTMKAYIEKIIVPFMNSKRKQLKLNADHRALAIVDKFKGQCTSLIFKMLDTSKIDIIYVTGFAKMCIVHISNFSTLKIHKICCLYHTGMKCARIVVLLSLYVSCKY